MTPIKRIVFNIDWLEEFILNYYGKPKDILHSVSAFTRDTNIKAVAFTLFNEYCEYSASMMNNRYLVSRPTISEYIRKIKDHPTEDYNQLKKQLENICNQLTTQTTIQF